MAYTKTIICLANSRMNNGYCVAGKEFVDGQFGSWIRPVSSRETKEIRPVEQRYDDGGYPALLDFIEIDFAEHQPRQYQNENYIVETSSTWRKVGVASLDEVIGALDEVEGPLWLNGHSTRYGFNDYVPASQIGMLGRSLYLVRPDSFEVYSTVEWPGEKYASIKARGSFDLNGINYKLKITDPLFEENLEKEETAPVQIENPFLCISITEVIKGRAMKLIAGIVTPNQLR